MTRCAGEIAAVPNTYCAVGVAYGAKVSGKVSSYSEIRNFAGLESGSYSLVPYMQIHLDLLFHFLSADYSWSPIINKLINIL